MVVKLRLGRLATNGGDGVGACNMDYVCVTQTPRLCVDKLGIT